VPVFTIFAGPNGSGKSSIIDSVAFVGRNNFLEADAIAKRIHATQPQSAAIAAGREVLRRTQEYLDSGEDFAIETTLSGNWTLAAVREARVRRFFVRLVYICLESPEQCIRRVRERVAQGGHDVPNEDVRRRYFRSLMNAKQLVTIVDETFVYDNSGPAPKLIVDFRAGRIVSKSTYVPDWARGLLESAPL
jgi:predicted ABC-type ATPase